MPSANQPVIVQQPYIANASYPANARQPYIANGNLK